MPAIWAPLMMTLSISGSMNKHWDRMGVRKGPTVVVIQSPGYQRKDVKPMLDNLWLAGFVVLNYEFQPYEQNEESMKEALIKDINNLKEKYTIISHGIGGRITAELVAENRIHPDAAAFIGVPLTPRCSPALLDSIEDTKNARQTEIAFGSAYPPDMTAMQDWMRQIKAWCKDNKTIDMSALSIPHWHGGSGLDNIAPPETSRPTIGNGTFHRAGPLSFSLKEPNHVEIISDKETLKAMIKWLRKRAKQ